MAASTGYILAAAAVTAANEIVFAPLAHGEQVNFKDMNWRIVPATAVAAIALATLDSLSPPLGVGLAVFAFVIALVVPFGNAPSPIENVSKYLGLKTA